MIIFDEEITLKFPSTKSLNIDQVEIQVTGCCYKQIYVRVAVLLLFVSLRLFWGGPKSIFSLFRNKKASFKGMYMLNGVHMRVSFNTESLKARATHFKMYI